MDHRRDAVGDLFATFSTNLAASGGVAHRAESLDETVTAILGILPGSAPATFQVASFAVNAHPALVDALTASGQVVQVATDPEMVRDEPVGLTSARLAIAETGSVLLVEPEVADRSVSLMTETLIVLCPIESLVPSLDEAAGTLRDISASGSSYSTFVTGPSRTADIERQLTIGVQGPSAMHVVFLTDPR